MSNIVYLITISAIYRILPLLPHSFSKKRKEKKRKEKKKKEKRLSAVCDLHSVVVNGIVPSVVSAVKRIICTLVPPNSEIRLLYCGVGGRPVFSTQQSRTFGPPAVVAFVRQRNHWILILELQHVGDVAKVALD